MWQSWCSCPRFQNYKTALQVQRCLLKCASASVMQPQWSAGATEQAAASSAAEEDALDSDEERERRVGAAWDAEIINGTGWRIGLKGRKIYIEFELFNIFSPTGACSSYWCCCNGRKLHHPPIGQSSGPFIEVLYNRQGSKRREKPYKTVKELPRSITSRSNCTTAIITERAPPVPLWVRVNIGQHHCRNIPITSSSLASSLAHRR